MAGRLAILLAVILVACGSPTVVATPNPSAAGNLANPSISLAPSASPSPSPSPSPTPTATDTPSPTPSPTPQPPLALSHCTGKTGKVSSTSITHTEKYFAGLLDLTPSKTVSCIEASWVEPSISCAAGDNKSDVSIWLAIAGTDGKGTTGTHERGEKAGSEAFCSFGAPTYTAWTYSHQKTDGYHDATFFVSVHDQMWAQVKSSGHTFKMSIADLTTREIMTTTATVKDAIRENAQWTVEAPELGCPKKCVAGPLVKFGPIVYSGAEAVINGVLQSVDRWPRQTTTMATGSTKRAVVSKLGKGTFTVTWRHT